MSNQEIVHVVGVLDFIHQDPFHHDARGGIFVGKEPDQFLVMVTGDPLSDQILFNHLDQICAFGVFRGGSDRKSVV